VLPDADLAAELGFRYAPLDELLGRADFNTLHVPLRDDTRHLIDARALALVKPGAILVNTSRGPVVDTAALKEALAAGRLRGAGLDVNPDLAMGLSIPVVVVIVALGMHKIRKVVLRARD